MVGALASSASDRAELEQAAGLPLSELVTGLVAAVDRDEWIGDETGHRCRGRELVSSGGRKSGPTFEITRIESRIMGSTARRPDSSSFLCPVMV
jgi:hypothetical protein